MDRKIIYIIQKNYIHNIIYFFINNLFKNYKLLIYINNNIIYYIMF